MTNDIDLSIREIDDLLQHLYLKLKGKKEGLSLVEPAAILLARLKRANPSFYAPQLARFTPIIMDALISEAYVSFGYEGLESINDVAGDIPLATGDYIPAGVEEGLSRIREEIDSISAILIGDSTAAEISADASGKSETGTGGFFRERAWGTAGLPLVSTYNTGKTPFSTGRVVKARVEIRITGEWSIRQKRDPVINFEHISAEPNSPFERQIRTAVRVAEEFAATTMGMGSIQRIPREYRISLPEIASFPASAIQRLSGGSAGLAIATLLVSVLGRLDLYRFRLRINPAIAFTGTVDETGNILAVEDSHIANKVRAVFFSRFSKLILPAGNLDTAERELAALSRKHPARKLDLVPASDIVGIFGDSGVTTRRMAPAGKSVLQWLFFWRKHLLTAASLAALVIISLFIVRPYYRRDIAKIVAKGNRIAITNKFGRLITEHELGFTVSLEMEAYHKSFIGDFDSNGDNEAVCVLTESRHLIPSSPYNRLHFISFDNEGRFRFSYIYDDEKLLGDHMNPDGQAFPISSTRHTTIFRDDCGKSRLLAMVNHASRRPMSVISLSLEDFSRRIFLHQGFLFHMALKDIDSDGTRDIVLSGYNNILKSCVVVVLDQRYMHGSSPENRDYAIAGFEEDIAKYYLRLPDFYGYVPYSKNDWFPLSARIKNSQEGLIVMVRTAGNDTRFFLTDSMKCIGAEVVESFTKNETSDSDSTIAYDYPGKEQDEKMLRMGVRYWDGENWVAEPTVNKSYLEHVVKAADKTIAQVELVRERLVMKNGEGYQVADYDVGFRTPKSGAYRKIFFGDFLEDEGDEILCVLNNSRYIDKNDPDRNKLFILIFDENGQLLRRYVYHEESTIGSEMERAARNISIQMITSSSPLSEECGPGYLFVGTHHKMEPPVSLIKFSLDDGSYQIFFHKGFIREMAARDVDGDGRSELLMTGYNVSLDAPVIVVLDPDHVDGSSPRGACYNVPGREKDIAKYYIRLSFYHGFERYNSRMYPLNVNILENAGRLRIIVNSRAEEVIYSIADHMVFTGAEVVRVQHKGKGQPDIISTTSYPGIEKDKKQLLRDIRYWDGEEWVPEPTVNRSYLRHVKAHNDTLAWKGK